MTLYQVLQKKDLIAVGILDNEVRKVIMSDGIYYCDDKAKNIGIYTDDFEIHDDYILTVRGQDYDMRDIEIKNPLYFKGVLK
jgi:hypothetical protein